MWLVIRWILLPLAVEFRGNLRWGSPAVGGVVSPARSPTSRLFPNRFYFFHPVGQPPPFEVSCVPGFTRQLWGFPAVPLGYMSVNIMDQ